MSHQDCVCAFLRYPAKRTAPSLLRAAGLIPEGSADWTALPAAEGGTESAAAARVIQYRRRVCLARGLARAKIADLTAASRERRRRSWRRLGCSVDMHGLRACVAATRVPGKYELHN